MSEISSSDRVDRNNIRFNIHRLYEERDSLPHQTTRSLRRKQSQLKQAESDLARLNFKLDATEADRRASSQTFEMLDELLDLIELGLQRCPPSSAMMSRADSLLSVGSACNNNQDNRACEKQQSQIHYYQQQPAELSSTPSQSASFHNNKNDHNNNNHDRFYNLMNQINGQRSSKSGSKFITKKANYKFNNNNSFKDNNWPDPLTPESTHNTPKVNKHKNNNSSSRKKSVEETVPDDFDWTSAANELSMDGDSNDNLRESSSLSGGDGVEQGLDNLYLNSDNDADVEDENEASYVRRSASFNSDLTNGPPESFSSSGRSKSVKPPSSKAYPKGKSPYHCCVFCNNGPPKNHISKNCHKYTHLDQRIDRLRELGLCKICFTEHYDQCKKSVWCNTCKKTGHFDLLCYDHYPGRGPYQPKPPSYNKNNNKSNKDYSSSHSNTSSNSAYSPKKKGINHIPPYTPDQHPDGKD